MLDGRETYETWIFSAYRDILRSDVRFFRSACRIPGQPAERSEVQSIGRLRLEDRQRNDDLRVLRRLSAQSVPLSLNGFP